MKRAVILAFLILFIPSVLAVSVTLNSPTNGNTSSSSSLTFNCSVSDASFDISTVKLYTDISGSWAQTESTVSGNVATASFDVTSISDGSYSWNCLAENTNSDTAYASSNFSFTISTGTFSGTIPNQTWEEETTISEAFDLDDYFTGATTYSVTGNSSITIDISSENKVSFTPAANYSGTENVTFTSDNGGTSNEVSLTVTNTNDPPYLIENISDQEAETNEVITIDMSQYFGEHDTEDTLNYTISSLYFTLEEDGDSVTVTPEVDWEGSEEVTITASDGSLSAISNTFTITIGESTNDLGPSLTSFSPSSDPSGEIGESFSFSIDTDVNVTYMWFIDDTEQEETSNEFTFTPETAGSYEIKVEVTDETGTNTQSWTLTITEEAELDTGLADENTEECGNGIIEGGENCLTCPTDVICQTGYVCGDTGICEKKKSAARALLIFFVVFFGIILTGILIYIGMNLRKGKQNPPQMSGPTAYYNPQQ